MPEQKTKYLENLPLTEDFLKNHPKLCLEVGCGNGDFLTQSALAEPDKTFIGCDIKPSRCSKTVKKITRHELNNAFVFTGRGEVLLESLPDESLNTFFMNFPDPWPKKRHHKRRFFYSQDILKLLEKKLVKGGSLYFVSDHKEYFFFVLQERLLPNPFFSSVFEEGYTQSLPSYFVSLYEKRWREENREIFYALFKKKVD